MLPQHRDPVLRAARTADPSIADLGHQAKWEWVRVHSTNLSKGEGGLAKLREEEHRTTDHRCPAEGCKVGKGRQCTHMTARCKNRRDCSVPVADPCHPRMARATHG